MTTQAEEVRRRARKLVDAGKYKEATTDLATLIALEPNKSVHYVNLAKAYWFQNDYHRADAALTVGYQKVSGSKSKILEEAFRILTKSTDESSQLLLLWFDKLLLLSDRSTKRKIMSSCLLGTNQVDKTVLANHLKHKYPDDEVVLLCLIEFFNSIGDCDQAINMIETLLETDRNSAELAIIRLQKGLRPFDLEQQLRIVEDVLNKDPQLPDIQHGILLQAKINVLHQGTFNAEAIKILENINASDRATAETLRQEYFFKHYESRYKPDQLKTIVYKWSEKQSALPQMRSPAAKRQSEKKDIVHSKPLRIGFISKNFRAHPIGWMTAGLFCELRHSLPDLATAVLFSTGRYDDFIATTIKTVAKGSYYDVADFSDARLLDLINQQNIDCLVDLDGMIYGNRLHVVVAQNAPVVKWVGGLIGSTYINGIDYLITDHMQTPSEYHADFTESLLLFDRSYVTYTPPPYKLELQEAPCLSSREITFGCFNNGVKLTEETFAAWARILRSVPNSKLFIKDRAFDQKMARERVVDTLSINDIDSSRLTVVGGSSHEDHLKAHCKVDICLDPLPYSGGLSTLEAAYMGVPVVSRPGRLLAHRHSASHLASLNSTELIAESTDEYVDLATSLAKDVKRINHYRKNLRSMLYQGPLLDHEGFAREFIKKLATL